MSYGGAWIACVNCDRRLIDKDSYFGLIEVMGINCPDCKTGAVKEIYG